MYSAADINHDEYGRCSYTLLINNKPSGTIKLSVPGVHNVYNSLSAIAACIKLGISMEAILKGLVNFTGTDRRFQKKGVFNGITVVDDYAHHPDEITATLNSAKMYPHNRIWCVFQPHTFSRTAILLDDFAEALKIPDQAIISAILPVRETNTYNIYSTDLGAKVPGSVCLDTFEEITDYVCKNAK